MKTTKVQLTGYYTDMPQELYLRTFLYLRHIRKVGDTEIVNNYQLGKLNESKANGSIDFIKLDK